MAHVAERLMVLVTYAVGSSMGVISGADIKSHIVTDLGDVKPTIFLTVPRLWNLFY